MKTGKIMGQCLLAGALLCSGTGAWSQDIHFSQFFEAPLLRNPSLAGIFEGDVRVQGVYRDQWNSVTNAYRSGSLNAEYKMPVGRGDDFISTGLQILFDKAGTVGLTTTHFLPAINYHKSLSSEKPMYLSLGFMGGMVRKSFDMSKMTTDEQYGPGGFNPTLPNGELLTSPNFTSWDASVGMSFNTSFGQEERNMLFLGAAYHHLNRPKNSFYRNPDVELQPKYVLSAGVKFDIDDWSYFTLQADHSIQGTFNETIGGALYSFKLGDLPDEPLYTLHAGAFLRWKDALIPVIKIDKRPLSLAISYDVNVSQLKTVSQGRGGFELSLSYVAFLDRDNSSRDKVLCPRF
ncbi:MAG: PorP/SprF family type IX secretion system membrane protein [Candidatus Pseudobacter hemicellulosilyticus]|uniref:PorP/SprF family type IX secretion system membrane protein n=1 Tax=Candidatus Pseudobacter hemicellulosilyticus TaxID=3121375 RepID=A0AAJ6BHV2_9BACT|nr:MAG: PorP/SprF family type IX secretion system membrane protein [Pseudobacter sp.]